MQEMTRRSFLRDSAAVGAAVSAGCLAGVPWLAGAEGMMGNTLEAEFGISDALCGRVLARALERGGDFADLYFEHTIRHSVVLEDGQVNQAYSNIDLGVGIRTVSGDQVGYGFTQELTEPAMLAAAATAATIADSAAGSAPERFAPLSVPNRYPLSGLLSAVPLRAKLDAVQAVNDRCFALSPNVVKANVTFHDEEKRIMVVTSDGRKAADLLPKSYLAASVVVERDGRRERAGWNFGGRRGFSHFTPQLGEELAQEVVRRALTLLDAIQPPAGEMPVVLGPGVTGILLHEAIGHGMEADFNRKGISTYCTMLGQQVAEPEVTIVDDGTNEGLLGALNVDDEGTPGQQTVLVERGILASYMHDKISARHYGVEPTGNGRRESYQHYVLPRMRNTYMLSGPATPDEVIRAAGMGIYVQDVSNGQVKIGDGDFAFYVAQGRLIEEGRLTAPIKDVNIMGNGPKLLRNVIMVGNDLAMSRGGAGYCGKDGQTVPVGFGLPTVLVKSLTVGGVRPQGA